MGVLMIFLIFGGVLKAQSPGSCNLAVSPDTISLPPSGGTATWTVSWINGCAESGTLNTDIWFSVNQTVQGQIAGQPTVATITITSPPNPGPTRTASYTYNVFGFNSSGTETVTITQGAVQPPPSITTPSPLPPGILGQSYSATLTATGGTRPYSWTISALSLPKGVSLSASGNQGLLSGSIASDAEAANNFDTVNRQFDFNVTVQDSIGQRNIKAFTIKLTCGDDRDKVIEEYQTYNTASYTLGINPFPLNPPSTGKGIQPYCAAFTNSAYNANFTFAQLNVNDSDSPNWALIRTALTTNYVVVGPNYGLSDWVAQYNAWANLLVVNAVFKTLRRINSGYRSPVQQAMVSGNNELGEPCTDPTLTDVAHCTRGGRHQFGDAVDLQNNLHTNPQEVVTQAQCKNPSSSAHILQLCTEWNAMVLAAQRAGAVTGSGYIEKLNESGIGHVHADWRNTPGQFEHGPNDPQNQEQ